MNGVAAGFNRTFCFPLVYNCATIAPEGGTRTLRYNPHLVRTILASRSFKRVVQLENKREGKSLHVKSGTEERT